MMTFGTKAVVAALMVSITKIFRMDNLIGTLICGYPPFFEGKTTQMTLSNGAANERRTNLRISLQWGPQGYIR